jgi:hypothetical protein
MARKKLLTEGEIRQFMKLANLRPIGTAKLSEYGMHPGARDEEMEMGAEEEVGMEDDMGDEEIEVDAEEEIDVEDDMDAEGGGDMVSIDDFMDALEMAIEDVTGEPASVEEVPGDEEEVEMDAEVMGGDEMEMEMGAEEEMVAEVIRKVSARLTTRSREDRIVNEVASRVAQRLQRQNQNEKVVDQLAERIMKRLTK